MTLAGKYPTDATTVYECYYSACVREYIWLVLLMFVEIRSAYFTYNYPLLVHTSLN